jgi:hypothetical protein
MTQSTPKSSSGLARSIVTVPQIEDEIDFAIDPAWMPREQAIGFLEQLKESIDERLIEAREGRPWVK